jgi:hypothetical protein
LARAGQEDQVDHREDQEDQAVPAGHPEDQADQAVPAGHHPEDQADQAVPAGHPEDQADHRGGAGQEDQVGRPYLEVPEVRAGRASRAGPSPVAPCRDFRLRARARDRRRRGRPGW